MSNLKSKTLRSWLLAGAAVAVATSGTAFAQGQQSVETVVVTGSLIQRTPGDMPTPTVILSSDAIVKTGMPNVGNVLQQLPQVQNSGDLTPLNSNFLTGGFGVWNVDLRGLGASRTLVLVNGMRQVTGSPTGSAVDLNTIPTALIDHVDIITGGASATYGSDAIAGVVNFVLKQDFEGIAASLQTGISSRGDGADTTGTLTIGGNFANDRGNVTLSVTYDHSGAIMSKNRDITSTDTSWFPGLFQFTGTYAGPVEQMWGLGAAYSTYGAKGRFRVACDNTNGQVVAGGFNGSYVGCSTGSYNPDGSTFNTAVDGFDRNPNRYIQVPVSRKVIAATSHYDITNWLTAFIDASYTFSHAAQQMEPYPGSSEDGLSAPTSANGIGILIPRDNPFIPANLQTLLTSTGSYYSNTAHHMITVDNNLAPGLFYYRRFLDLGDRTGQVDRNMEKIAFGLKGTLPISDWTWKSYYEWGRTEESQTNGGYYDKIKMQQALDTAVATAADIAGGAKYVTVGATNYRCADPIAVAAGCVPINLFGQGAITPEAAKYVGSLVTIQDWAEEQVAHIETSGSLFELPGGKAKLAMGAEYRRESANFVPDSASQAGTVAGNQQPATSGAFDVKELFAEGVVPIIKDVPGIKYLEIDGAVRWAHYSTAGNATSWNYRGIYKPIEDVTFRAAYSSSTRAPNISELYSPAAQTFPGVSTTADPCRVQDTPNCIAARAATGAPAGVYPSYTQAAAQGIGGYISGNPDLKPETAHTLTLGVVYSPAWLPAFQATVDFYDIRIHGYIGSLGVTSTLQACYDANAAPYASNVFCQQIIRQNDPSLGPVIKQINFPTFNLGSIKTDGVDMGISYAFAMSDLAEGLENAGAFAMKLNLSYIDAYSVDPGTVGSTPTAYGGTVGTPHFHGIYTLTYSNDPLTVTTSLRYVGGAYLDRTYPFMTCGVGGAAVTPNSGCTNVVNALQGNAIPSTWYIDMNVSYDLTKELQIYVGANNLFDVRPPETYPGGGYDNTGTGTVADVYDPIGQYFYTGLRVKL